MATHLVTGLLGAALGGLIGGGTFGVLAGLAIGVLWSQARDAVAEQSRERQRLAVLERSVEILQAQVRSLREGLEQATRPVPTRDVSEPAETTAPPVSASIVQPARRAPETPMPAPVPVIGPRPPELPSTAPPPAPSVLTPGAGPFPAAVAGVTWLIEFFTTGNVVAKVGIVILLFGVAFLVSFVAERGLLPIEYRLSAAAAGALVLLGLGWRLRQSRRDYALALQGGAVGILYLTIFAAFHLYGLLPASFTFALMLLVVALSGALAVVQNAPTLAVLGTGGGFLAPLLASTGSGSHVTLFSYYVVLNLGVVGLAWFRSWRLLNWLGFVSTFGVGLLWGGQYYTPNLLRSTEPFLIVFFLMYVAIAVLFALRRPPELGDFIDGSIVFGTPAIAFGMQSVLVGAVPFGRAYSAVVASALYLALARAMWRRTGVRQLGEAFLAIGIVFLTIAVPLAFAGHVTAATWALEGAAMVWVGLRQRRPLARAFGVALQAASGAAVMLTPVFTGSRPFLNSMFLACALVAAGGLVSAYHYAKQHHARWGAEGPLEWLLLGWGLIWWFEALGREVERIVDPPALFAAMTIAVALSTGALATLARALTWRPATWATMLLLPCSTWLVLTAFVTNPTGASWTNGGWVAWPLACVAGYGVLWMAESVWHRRVLEAWHMGSAWLVIFLWTWTGVALVRPVANGPAWTQAMWAVGPTLAIVALLAKGRVRPWPIGKYVLPGGLLPLRR